MRLGLYGGSFDPIHLGHLFVARAALEELELDRLIFVPAFQSPFKPGQAALAASWRVGLVRRALAGCPEYEVSEYEVGRGGVSYSIETVRHFSEQFGEAKLFYLIGADNVESLPLWKEARALAEKVEFAVIPRPGVQPVPPEGFRCVPLEGVPIGVSSSMIRRRISSGLSVSCYLPAAVDDAIRVNRLYSGD